MLLDGKVVKQHIMEELKNKVKDLNAAPGLSVIQVGEDQASSVYIKQKNKMSQELGYNFSHIKMNENVTTEEIINIIKRENDNPNVDGILVQMPLPLHVNANIIQNTVDYRKDVDGLTDINAGRLIHKEDCLMPCTPLGIMKMLDYYHIPIQRKNVVIVGRSDLIGKPIAQMMLNRNATVTICHSGTKNLYDITQRADILVVAVGKPYFITAPMIKDGAVVIDVGINRINGKLCGDVDFPNVEKHCEYITPVPGGVGQLTVATLGENVFKAYCLNRIKK